MGEIFLFVKLGIAAYRATGQRGVAGLKVQAVELDHLAVLRKQHERAGDLFSRDDDEPHHNTARPAGESGGSPDDGAGAGKPSAPGWSSGSFESFAPIVLPARQQTKMTTGMKDKILLNMI